MQISAPIAQSWQRRQRRAYLAGLDRIGAHARRQIWDAQRRWLRQSWTLLVCALGAGALLVVWALLFAPSAWTPYLAGAAAASVGWGVYVLMLETGGIAHKRAGVAAEQWTVDELRPLLRRGWYLVNHVMLPTGGDVDHVLIGPGGFFAIETKRRSDWSSSWTELGPIADRAAYAADRMRSRVGIKAPRVGAVVAMWGPGAAARAASQPRLGDVTFCTGTDLRAHVESFGRVVEPAAVDAAFSWLDGYVRQRDHGELARSRRPPRLVHKAMLDLVWAFAASCATLLVVIGAIPFEPEGWVAVAIAAVLGMTAVAARRRSPESPRLQALTAAVITTCWGVAALLLCGLAIVAIA
jgi:hypothetical protein